MDLRVSNVVLVVMLPNVVIRASLSQASKIDGVTEHAVCCATDNKSNVRHLDVFVASNK